jgi:hypothetical protein
MRCSAQADPWNPLALDRTYDRVGLASRPFATAQVHSSVPASGS